MHLVYAKVIQSTKDIPALGFFGYYTTRVSLYMSGDHTEHIGNSFVLNPLRNSLPSYPPGSLDLNEIKYIYNACTIIIHETYTSTKNVQSIIE